MDTPLGLAQRVRRYEVATIVMSVLVFVMLVLQVVAFLYRNRVDTLHARRIIVESNGKDPEGILVSAGDQEGLSERDLPTAYAGVRVLLPRATGADATTQSGLVVSDG